MSQVPTTGAGYRGGKTYRNRSGVGRWIASLLPESRAYVEPFAGLAGILLQRKPAKVEVLNDLDDFIMNWWMCVRDAPTKFGRALRATPNSERVFQESRRLLDKSDFRFSNRPNLDIGVAAHVVMSQSFLRTTDAKSWALKYAPTSNGQIMRNQPDVEELAFRLERVQLTCRDAIKVLKSAGRTVGRPPGILIYCDPPYGADSTIGYRMDVDRDLLRDALLGVKAKCAISGYGEDWDCLGWTRHEFNGMTLTPNYDPSKHNAVRTDVLWTNFDPADSKKSRLF